MIEPSSSIPFVSLCKALTKREADAANESGTAGTRTPQHEEAGGEASSDLEPANSKPRKSSMLLFISQDAGRAGHTVVWSRCTAEVCRWVSGAGGGHTLSSHHSSVCSTKPPKTNQPVRRGKCGGRRR